MKSKVRWIVILLAAAGVYLIATALLLPRRAELLSPATQSPLQAIEDAQIELAQVVPTAPLTLITEPGNIATITAAIANAHKSVDLVIYELEDPQIEQALAAAQTRGVAVRVILDNLDTFGNYPNQAAYTFLKSHNVAVEWSPAYFALTHQKTLVVDASEAFVMTFNLTPQYYATSRDFALVDPDPADVAAIENAFTSDWSGSQDVAQDGDDLVWSPGAAGATLAIIAQASSTLDIYNEEMADPRVTQALEQAAARGVSVRVDMTYDTNWKSAFNNLVQHGVLVRTYASTAKFYIHAKVIVADQKEAFIGSQNFSSQSLDQNRELGILIDKPDIVSELEATFNQDWQGSRPYTVKN